MKWGSCDELLLTTCFLVSDTFLVLERPFWIVWRLHKEEEGCRVVFLPTGTCLFLCFISFLKCAISLELTPCTHFEMPSEDFYLARKKNRITHRFVIHAEIPGSGIRN